MACPCGIGWEIDVNSIKVTPTVISSKSSYSGVADATKDGFYIAGRIVNNGNCVKAFGHTVARDARGEPYAFPVHIRRPGRWWLIQTCNKGHPLHRRSVCQQGPDKALFGGAWEWLVPLSCLRAVGE